MSNSYEDRLRIPVRGIAKNFYTISGTLIATEYVRIVIGDRGPYVEFEGDHLIGEEFEVHEEDAWRLYSKKCFYIEIHSKDEANVKVYYQQKEVDYADYKSNLYYVSPFELYDEFGLSLIDDKD